ncbi:hypothetical protein PENTCL1PPCAC_16373 [Pristionchus entomophagus]|uniref:Uncharacterized protein n=1 Tax=Pristionchus entomophagus TaxID=358040 RepID=A0AAV5TIM8_9BILA|nr:hypothetical protein PENTCL1PPCAC_16373 [Pristionchus entomophagus]
MEFPSMQEEEGLAYIVKKNGHTRCGGESAISEISERDFFIRSPLFPSPDLAREHSLVRVTMRDMLTAHLYPVEPPLPPPSPPHDFDPSDYYGRFDDYDSISGEERKRKDSEGEKKSGKKPRFDPSSDYLKGVFGTLTASHDHESRRVVSRVRALDAKEADEIKDRLEEFIEYGLTGDMEMMDELFRLGSRYRDECFPWSGRGGIED